MTAQGRGKRGGVRLGGGASETRLGYAATDWRCREECGVGVGGPGPVGGFRLTTQTSRGTSVGWGGVGDTGRKADRIKRCLLWEVSWGH